MNDDSHHTILLFVTFIFQGEKTPQLEASHEELSTGGAWDEHYFFVGRQFNHFTYKIKKGYENGFHNPYISA